MSFNSQKVITDGSNVTPVPQFYNQNDDKYEVLNGIYGASMHNGNAPYVSGSVVVPSGNTQTYFDLELGSLSFGDGMFDAKSATIAVVNGATGQTITGLNVILYDNIGGQEVDITYPASSVSVASGSNGTFIVPFVSGVLANIRVQVLYSTAPTTGSVYVKVSIQGSGSGGNQVSLTGSNATKITNDGTGSGNTVGVVPWGQYDGNAENVDSLVVAPYNLAFNENGWDRVRNNTQGTLLASAARTSPFNSPAQTNFNGRGVILLIDVTAISGTNPFLNFQFCDGGANYGYSNVSTNITATGFYWFILYPTAIQAPPTNSLGVVNMPLPRSWNLYSGIGGTTPSFTYSVTAYTIL